MTNITVFLSSRDTVPEFRSDAVELGRRIAAAGHTLVYGGAPVGLMGLLADGASEKGGNIIGITTHQLAALEGVHKHLTEDVRVPSLDQRRRLLLDAADAVVILPGGMGTLDELFQALTETQITNYTKPIILANLHGYYNGLIDFFRTAVFYGTAHQNNLPIVVSSLDDIMKALTI